MARTMAEKAASATRKSKVPKRATRRYGDILYEVKDQVAWVTINRPRVMNAFREQTLDELIDALKSTRDDPSIACAVVTGAGDKAFSAGGDFYAMKRLTWVNGAGASGIPNRSVSAPAHTGPPPGAPSARPGSVAHGRAPPLYVHPLSPL